MLESFPEIPTSKKPLDCVIRENQAIYFPTQWWHATLNLDESVFISTFINYHGVLNTKGLRGSKKLPWQ